MRNLRGRNKRISPDEIQQQNICRSKLLRFNTARMLYCSHLREISVLKVAQELGFSRTDVRVMIPDDADFIKSVQELQGVTLSAGIHKDNGSDPLLYLQLLQVPKPEPALESILQAIKKFKDHVWYKASDERELLHYDYLIGDLKEVCGRLKGVVPEITSVELLEMAILFKRLLGCINTYQAPCTTAAMAVVLERLATSEGMTLIIEAAGQAE